MTFPPSLDDDRIYRRNLAALRAFQPDVARRVDETPIPTSVVPSIGRDGSPTFRLLDQDGGEAWLGRSSMPRVSAEAVFGGLRRDGGNVWLPGVVTGVEPLVVASRIPRHSAVFVLEDDPLALRLALHLHDYLACLAAGRIVHVWTTDLEASLASFFERYPGYELPSHLLTVPQVPAPRIAELQRRIEKASEVVVGWQSHALESAAAGIRGRRLNGIAETPSIVVLSTNPSALALEQSSRIARGLARLGLRHEVCVPDAPGKCHALARIRAVERGRADCILVIGDGARWLRPLLPRQVPIGTLGVPGESVPAILPDQIGPADLLFAASSRIRDEWLAAGINPERVRHCPPAADAPLETTGLEPSERAEPAADVVLLMDLPDSSARACGMTLASHVALWTALQDIAAQRIGAGDATRPDEWLARAVRRSGVEVSDGAVREMFLSMIRHRLAPATVRRAAAQATIDAGREVLVWGQGWARSSALPVTVKGGTPVGAGVAALLRSARVAVLPDLSERAVQLALDALCLEIPVVCVGRRSEFNERYPGLEPLASAISYFRSPAELPQVLAGLRAESSRERHHGKEVAATIRTEHSTASRLSWMISALRERRFSPGFAPRARPAGTAPTGS